MNKISFLVISVAISVVPVTRADDRMETKLVASPIAVPKVYVVEDTAGWTLKVDGQPFFIKGIAYDPDKVGQDPGTGTLRDWMVTDSNGNGKIDSPYDSFVDANNNNIQDGDEPTVGDFQLLKEMNVNTIRVYHHPSNAPEVLAGYGTFFGTRVHYNHPPNKELLRDLYKTYGIRVMMGDFLGAYGVGSGNSPTDYRDPVQQQRMLKSVLRMVADFRDEDFLLMYVLGNENNYPATASNASQFPTEYAQFVERAARLIHLFDKNHPVAICMGDLGLIDQFKLHAPSVDIFGANVYRGQGFGDFFAQAKNRYGKPVLLTEYGYVPVSFQNGEINQSAQSSRHQFNWNSIIANAAGGNGSRNAIGGVAFQWLDGWWKAGTPSQHTQATEEWHGLAGQGNGTKSPFLRQLRQVYFMYKSLWAPAMLVVPSLASAPVPAPKIVQNDIQVPRFKNIFNPSRELLSFDVEVPGSGVLTATAFNTLGQKVRTLYDQDVVSSRAHVEWDGRDDGNDTVGSGVYLLRLSWRGQKARQIKIIVLR